MSEAPLYSGSQPARPAILPTPPNSNGPAAPESSSPEQAQAHLHVVQTLDISSRLLKSFWEMQDLTHARLEQESKHIEQKSAELRQRQQEVEAKLATAVEKEKEAKAALELATQEREAAAIKEAA